MDNQHNSPSNQNENPTPNQPINSVDGFARPSQSTGYESPSTNSPPSLASRDTTSYSESKDDLPSSDSKPLSPPPVITASKGHKQSGIWTVVLVILIIVVFAGGTYGVYNYQQKKINSLNTQVTTLTSENNSLNSQLTKAKSSTSVSVNSSSTGSSALTVYKIPELGVSLSVPANLADLSYVANSAKTSVNLSTQDLTTLASTCSATATVGPLGTIIKTSGNFPTTPSTTTTLIKQYPTYYIAYVKPTSTCSSVSQINTLTNSLITDLKTSFPTVQLITS